MESVAVGTTHNHSVPVTLELGGAWIRRNRELVAPYVDSVFEAIGQAAAEASTSLRPVRVGAALGHSPLAVNRRMTTADRRAAVGLAPDRVTDPTLTVVRLDGDDDRPVATIVHYVCHPIILGPDNTFVTPEYPGIVIGDPLRRPSPPGTGKGYRNYLPTDAERARGGYEIDISPFTSGAEALVTEAAAQVLRAF